MLKAVVRVLLILGFVSGAFAAPLVLDATEFGIRADGVSDDGPVIRAMLADAGNVNGPVELRFPENKVIAVTFGTDRYVFNLERRKDMTINSQGSEFRLDPYLCFLDAFQIRQHGSVIKVCRLHEWMGGMPGCDDC